MNTNEKTVILFQGDSVTDCDRSREDDSYFGFGYVNIIAKRLEGTGCKVYNRGVSGNRLCDLVARKEEDIFAIKPDIFSILIGVNDTWRRYDSDIPETAEEFERIYRELLDEIKERLPEVPIVIMAPFILEVPDKKHWIEEDLCFKQDVVRKLAAEYADVYIPLDKIFKEEFDKHDDIYYLSGDGVHPNEIGHTLIADHWLSAIQQA